MNLGTSDKPYYAGSNRTTQQLKETPVNRSYRERETPLRKVFNTLPIYNIRNNTPKDLNPDGFPESLKKNKDYENALLMEQIPNFWSPYTPRDLGHYENTYIDMKDIYPEKYRSQNMFEKNYKH